MGTSTPRHRRSGFNPLLALLLIVLGVLGVAGTLHATGRVHIQIFDDLLGREVQAADDGMVAVTVSARTLRPGHAVTTEDLWNAEAGFYRVVRVEPDKVNEAWILNPLEIEGRVMGRTKGPGKTFSEADFLPPGSQEGPMSLVPDDMRGLILDGTKVRGLDKLRYKDRFDLVVSQKVDSELFDRAQKDIQQRGGSQLDKQLKIEALKEMANQRVLVRGGLLIEPADSAGSKKEKDVIIALSPEEVMPLLEALDLGHTIVCVARTGKAGVEVPDVLADQASAVEQLEWVWKDVKEIEVFTGDERKVVTVPKVEIE